MTRRPACRPLTYTPTRGNGPLSTRQGILILNRASLILKTTRRYVCGWIRTAAGGTKSVLLWDTFFVSAVMEDFVSMWFCINFSLTCQRECLSVKWSKRPSLTRELSENSEECISEHYMTNVGHRMVRECMVIECLESVNLTIGHSLTALWPLSDHWSENDQRDTLWQDRVMKSVSLTILWPMVRETERVLYQEGLWQESCSENGQRQSLRPWLESVYLTIGHSLTTLWPMVPERHWSLSETHTYYSTLLLLLLY